MVLPKGCASGGRWGHQACRATRSQVPRRRRGCQRNRLCPFSLWGTPQDCPDPPPDLGPTRQSQSGHLGQRGQEPGAVPPHPHSPAPGLRDPPVCPWRGLLTVGTVPRAGSGREDHGAGELPGPVDRVVGCEGRRVSVVSTVSKGRAAGTPATPHGTPRLTYDGDGRPGQQGEEREEQGLVGVQEVLEETGPVCAGTPSARPGQGHPRPPPAPPIWRVACQCLPAPGCPAGPPGQGTRSESTLRPLQVGGFPW